MIVQVKKVKFSTNHRLKTKISDQNMKNAKKMNGTIPFVDEKTRNFNRDTDQSDLQSYSDSGQHLTLFEHI